MRWGNSDREVDRVGVFGWSFGEEGVSCWPTSSRACRRAAERNDVHRHSAHTDVGRARWCVAEVRTGCIASIISGFVCPDCATHVETTGWLGTLGRGPAERDYLQDQARTTTPCRAEAWEMRRERDHESRGDVSNTCVDHRLIASSTTHIGCTVRSGTHERGPAAPEGSCDEQATSQ
jgi:hypothetical protein